MAPVLSEKAKSSNQKWIWRFLLLAVLGVTIYLRSLASENRLPEEARMKEVLLLPPGDLLRKLDLGYHTLFADILFIRANIYYGQHMMSDQQLPWLPHFINVLIQLDPQFKKIYFWGALATTYYQREISNIPPSLITRANQILELGMNRFPEDYRFPMRIAFNHYYEMGDADAALPYFVRASGLPGAPSWIKDKLAELSVKSGQKDLAQQTLDQMIRETDDPTLAKALQARLRQINQSDQESSAAQFSQELIQDWLQHFGYCSFDLYLLVREP